VIVLCKDTDGAGWYGGNRLIARGDRGRWRVKRRKIRNCIVESGGGARPMLPCIGSWWKVNADRRGELITQVLSVGARLLGRSRATGTKAAAHAYGRREITAL
jgi:hypothetical protein